jgi:hypothetical protein
MQESVIYVVITTHLLIHRRLLNLFTGAMQKHPNIDTNAGPLPGLPTYTGDPYDRNSMQFVFSEHLTTQPLMMDTTEGERPNRVMPAIPYAPLGHQVLISVLGRTHTGKTTVIRELEAALLEDEVPANHIQRFTLDHPSPDIDLSSPDNATCIARMKARRIVFLFQKPQRDSDLTDVLMRCGATKRPTQET